MVSNILQISALIILIAMLVAVIRFVIGPKAADRLVAFDVMTVSSIGVIALIALNAGRIIYLDVAIVYGLLSFLGVIIVARYIEKGM